MSLKPLSAQQPLGQFDGVDSELTSLKGGEVVTVTSVATTGSSLDKAAPDAFDGYMIPSLVQKRPAITKTLTAGKKPLWLADEGITGYGTILGSLVGGTVGQSVSGTVFGPHTTSGSGKVTCWNQPGLYAVSVDAVDTTVSTGLIVSNTSLDAGSALYATSAGLLTPTVGSAFESVVVGRFLEFATNGSLVTSNVGMVTALNSPSGATDPTRSPTFVVLHFNPAV
jgi:hypothetical protein